MSTSDKVRARLQLIDERLARLRAERDRLAARVSRTERKRDTRRKIVLGGAVLAALDHEGVPAHADPRGSGCVGSIPSSAGRRTAVCSAWRRTQRR